MKNWITIGNFSKQAGLTPRAVRLYEQHGLLKAHTRGENKYRYFTSEQVQLVLSIKTFKSFGFSLSEIKLLLEVDNKMDSEKLIYLLKQRLKSVESQQMNLFSTKERIDSIIASLKKKQKSINAQERKFIMTQLEKISVIVAGVRDLEMTAQYIAKHVAQAGKKIPVIVWDGVSELPKVKPYILVISEKLLHRKEVAKLNPDVVVIKELSKNSDVIQKNYLQLYNSVGPTLSTILNADDRAVLEFAANETVRKGKTYYFSKNSGLKSQIKKIGGVVSDGELIEVFGFNLRDNSIEIKMKKIVGIDEETSYLASLAAVLDFGITEGNLASV